MIHLYDCTEHMRSATPRLQRGSWQCPVTPRFHARVGIIGGLTQGSDLS